MNVESPRKYLLYYYGENNLEAIRNDRFKLVFPHEHATYLEAGVDGYPGKSGENISIYLYMICVEIREKDMM